MNTHSWIRFLAAGVLIASVGALLAEVPYHQRIYREFVFDQPIIWIGSALPPAAESEALWKAIEVAKAGGRDAGLTVIERFIEDYPLSAWVPSLRSHLAKYYREHGRYSIALQHWEKAWQLTKDEVSGPPKLIADRTLAHWTSLLASLGRSETLEKIFQETANRSLDGGPQQQRFNATREAYGVMIENPGIAYRCGTYALYHVAQKMNDQRKSRGNETQTNGNCAALLDIPSPQGGFTMTKLIEFSRQFDLGLIAAQRVTNQKNPIPVPSVVHWKQNHYAAITEEKNGEYYVVDPTFGDPLWLSASAIDAEASGYFLIPESRFGTGWHRLSPAETDAIYGKGYPNHIDDNKDESCPPGTCCPAGRDPMDEFNRIRDLLERLSSGYLALMGGGGFGALGAAPPSPPAPSAGGGSGCSPCSPWNPYFHAMAQWRISEPYMTLWIDDEPLGYQPPRGDRISFHLSYKQRDMVERDARVFNLGPLWNCTWLSYVDDVSTTRAEFYVGGGGVRPYNPDGVSIEHNSVSRLRRFTNSTGTLTNFHVLPNTGARDEYDFIVTGIFTPPRAFLTAKIDRYGNATRLEYTNDSGNIRLLRVIDPQDKATTLTYGGTSNLITQVVDPYFRTNRLEYSVEGRLTNIIDVIGIASSFQYDTNGWITNLVTPYGSTYFQFSGSGTNLGGNQVNRSALITDPMAFKQLYVYRDTNGFLPYVYPSSEFPSDPVIPAGELCNQFMYFRNSWHWNRQQFQQLSDGAKTNVTLLSSNEYRLGRLRNWLHKRVLPEHISSGQFAVGHTLNMERDSSPSASSAIEGGKTWYGYTGKAAHKNAEGTNVNPTVIARRLPDGTDRFVSSQQNSIGLNTNEIGPLTAQYTPPVYSYRTARILHFATNNIDIIKVVGTLGETMTTSGYNDNHQLLAETNELSEVTAYAYYPDASLKTVRRPTGLTTTNIYSSDGHLIQTMDLEIFRTNSYTWTNGLLLSHTDERGLTRNFTYDALQRITSIVFPDGYTSNIYARLDLVGTRDELGNWTRYEYDSLRRLITQTNAASYITRYTYCDCGAVGSVTDALTNTTTYSYDLIGRLTQVSHPDGYTVTYNYNQANEVTNITDSAGLSITNTFTVEGNLRESKNAFGTLVKYIYDAYDRPSSILDAHGITTVRGYDPLDRLSSEEYGSGVTEQFLWATNVDGLVGYTDQLGHVTRYAYDAAGRKTAETNANLEEIRFTYNPAGDLLTLTDGNTNTTTWRYDEDGHVTHKLNHLGQTNFLYRYNEMGWLTNRWTPAQTNTFYAFDKIGNLTNVDYAASTDIRMSYDALNRLTNMVDAVGNTRYAYTAGGQLALEDGPWENDTVSYTYSHHLRTALSLQQPSAGSWAHSYGYDIAKRHTTITSPAGTFSYAYPGSGHILAKASPLHIKLGLPPGAYITNSHDHLARLTNTALKTSGNVLSNQHGYIYDAGNQRTRQTRTRGDYIDYGYDSIGQLKTAVGKEPGGSTNRLNEQFGYGYDKGGNLAHRTNNALVQDFQVNSLNQVPTATRSGTFTVAGRTSLAATNVTVNASEAIRYADHTFAKGGFALTDGTNSFTAVGQDSRGRSDTHTVSVFLPATNNLSYDANGNTVSIAGSSGSSAGQQLTLAYESDDKPLSRIVLTNQWKSEFVYDAKVRLRVRKEYSWRNGTWALTNEVRYIYDGTLVLQERDQNDVPRVTYTRGRDFGGNLEEAGGIGGLLARTDNTQLAAGYGQPHAYYHSDGSGNVVMLINSNQVAVASYLYDPFGKTLAISGPLGNPNVYRFSSMLVHQPSDLVLYPFRAYAPHLQRWLSPEPYGDIAHPAGEPPIVNKAELLPEGPSLYRFVANSPPNYIDYDGRLVAPPLVGIAICLRIPACRAAIAAAIAAAAHGVREICRPKKEEKGECEFYRAWCEWGNKKGHRPLDDPEKYWTKDAPCEECYKICKDTGKWPFDKCKMGGSHGPRWDPKRFKPVWP